ncbi:hypothetical protein EI94DRAFT_750058 [Lactarius quietus]|nr:hypothetical protein EI94DRAFT_750058 [Lactarius quietus]
MLRPTITCTVIIAMCFQKWLLRRCGVTAGAEAEAVCSDALNHSIILIKAMTIASPIVGAAHATLATLRDLNLRLGSSTLAGC